jgi:hypothetical protein
VSEMLCCAAYDAGYACSCPPLRVDDLVEIIDYQEKDLPFRYGVITEVVPRKGFMVRPDGHAASFGWGESELKFVSRFTLTRFEREVL